MLHARSKGKNSRGNELAWRSVVKWILKHISAKLPSNLLQKQHVPRAASADQHKIALHSLLKTLFYKGGFATFLTTSRHCLRADLSEDMSSAFRSAACNVLRSLTSKVLLSKFSIALPLSTAAMTRGSSSDNRLKIARSRKSASSS